MSQQGSRKEINFELDLLPVISILAVCISFLLMSAVWVHVGMMSTQQATGEVTLNSQNNPPSLWLQIKKNGDLDLNLKDINLPAAQRHMVLSSQTGDLNWSELNRTLSQIKQNHPQIKTALILPHQQFSYGKVIKMMDSLKKNNILDIGLSPL